VSVLGVLAAFALALFWQSARSSLVSPHSIGWAAGALVPMASLVWYRLRVRTLRARDDFSFTLIGSRLIVGAAVAGLGIGIYHGWFVANWLAT